MGPLNRRELLAASALGAVGLIAGNAPAQARTSKWTDLSRRLRGRLVRPGDDRYAGLATPRNLRYAALGLRDWAQAYYGANLGRLTRVKAKWDPKDVFTYLQGVPLRV